MKLKHIKTSIINNACNGSKTSRNNYADNIGAEVRYKRAIKKYKQSIIGGCIGINTTQVEALKREWQALGGSLKVFNRLGAAKVKQILKDY